MRPREPEYVVPLLFWALSPTGYYYSFLVLLVLLPWAEGTPDRVCLLELALLTAIVAVLYALEVASPDLVPLYWAASMSMAGFFTVWLGLEYVRLTTLGRRPAAGPNRRPEEPEALARDLRTFFRPLR